MASAERAEILICFPMRTNGCIPCIIISISTMCGDVQWQVDHEVEQSPVKLVTAIGHFPKNVVQVHAFFECRSVYCLFQVPMNAKSVTCRSYLDHEAVKQGLSFVYNESLSVKLLEKIQA